MTTETDWRAERDYNTDNLWDVWEFRNGKRHAPIICEIAEDRARLIAAAPAKAALLANALDLLGEAIEEDPKGYIAQNARSIVRRGKEVLQ